MRYRHLGNQSKPPNISDIGPFKAVVIINDNVDKEWQYMISKWIAENGCYYMMAWGNECSTWDDSVDFANLEQYHYNDIPDDKLIMTTWHENQTLSQVFWHCENCAHHDVNEITEIVIIDINKEGREKEVIDLYNSAQQGDAPDLASLGR